MRQLSVIEDGSLLIDRGIIREIGPTRRVENLAAARDAVEIDASGKVVMPGFVDAHAHLPGTFSARDGVSPTMAAAQSVRARPLAQLQSDAERAFRRFTQHGATSAGILSGFGYDERTDAKALRAVAALPTASLRVVASWYGLQGAEPGSTDAEENWQRVMESVIRRCPLDWTHAACGAGSFGAEACLRYMRAAQEHGLRIRLSFAVSGRICPLRELLVARPWTVDHLEFADRGDVQAIAESEIVAVLLPALSFALGSDRQAPARALADAGGVVALGSDYRAGIVDGFSMQFAIYLACRTLHLSVEEAITAATINAAHALRITRDTGSLEPGKHADLIVLGIDDYHELGAHFGVNLVEMTIHHGEITHTSGAGV